MVVRQSEQGGIIGILAHAYMFEPLTNNEHDKEAASRAVAYNVGWILDPLVFGDYPPEMRHYLGNELPTFTPEETELIKDSIDFVGMNHYGTLYVKDCLQRPLTSVATSSSSSVLHSHDSRCSKAADSAIRGFLEPTPLRDGVLIGEPTGKEDFFVVPRGMEGIVDYAKKRYNKPIFILENGYSFPPKTDDLEHDIERIDYHQEYLAFLARAMRNGADVRGYFIWSLMDNFEWAEGYSKKFGLYSINPGTLDRVPRASAKWYKDFLSGKMLSKKEPKTEVSFFSEKNGLPMDAKGGSAEM